MEPAPLTQRFDQALALARQLHAGQTRKGTDIPYISHLLAVTSLVLEDGGGEDEAIAALLHDAVEDQGGLDTLAEIRRQFGDRVADYVLGLSDTFEDPKPPWQQRKDEYLQHLRTAPPQVLRISLADKLHNARSIRQDLRNRGEALWDLFRGGREGTLWYYRTLVEIFQQTSPSILVAELAQVVEDIHQLAGEPYPQPNEPDSH